VLTDVDTLVLPADVRAAVFAGTREDLLSQRFDVGRRWWQQRLLEHGLEDDLFPAFDGKVGRCELFALGADAYRSPEAARRLLWASCAWGTGPSQRGNRRRIRGLAADPERWGGLLAEAAAAAGDNPTAAYEVLRPAGNVITGLGPAFFTKFLYFAAGGERGCLILDARVAGRLRRSCGWKSLIGTTAWPATTYARYLRLLTRWADELSSDDRHVQADEIEFRLFSATERSDAQAVA
jgi:hypothetical protein